VRLWNVGVSGNFEGHDYHAGMNNKTSLWNITDMIRKSCGF
jgi:hypothetical protein